MGAIERRFRNAVWIDGSLFVHVIVFFLLTLPETTPSTYLFAFHALHGLTFLLGLGTDKYPGNAATIRPLMGLTCVNIMLDFVAFVLHVLVAFRSSGRALGNQVIYAVFSVFFVTNDVVLMLVTPQVDRMARALPRGPMHDLTSAFGQNADGTKAQ